MESFLHQQVSADTTTDLTTLTNEKDRTFGQCQLSGGLSTPENSIGSKESDGKLESGQQATWGPRRIP